MPYLTSKKLGILPEERKALIAFVTKEAKGQVVSLNGRKHYYDQRDASYTFDVDGRPPECGTAGCVAGYVFAHVRYIQGKRSLRGRTTASEYIKEAWADEMRDGEYRAVCPLLDTLYAHGATTKLSDARRIVKKMLRTGKVKWC